MAIDLTRFDFNAKKFYFSDNVRIMSAEEVGQYVLLLVESWLGGKDASLPDNLTMLARMARGASVSEHVLNMFPVVETEHGSRRRNETLYEEWLEALGRSLNCSENGRKGGSISSEEKTLAARENGKKGGRPPVLITEAEPNGNRSETETSKPTQSNSIRSDQIKSNQSEGCHADGVSCNQEPAQWKNLAIPYRNVFGKKAGAEFKKRYFDACLKYTEPVVLECFRTWATASTADWCEANGFDRPLNLFFKKLPEEAADTLDLNESEKQMKEAAAAEKKRGDEIQAESIERQTTEIVALLSSANVPRESEGSLEDFLESLEGK